MINKILIVVFFALTLKSTGQVNLTNKTPGDSFDNVFVEKLAEDSTFSSFVILVKKGVKPHYHKDHSENIYVIEGTGEMLVDQKSLQLKPGDYINIPKGAIHSVKVTSNKPMKVLSIQSPMFDGNDRIFVNN